jgi:hypothetical protein
LLFFLPLLTVADVQRLIPGVDVLRPAVPRCFTALPLACGSLSQNGIVPERSRLCGTLSGACALFACH